MDDVETAPERQARQLRWLRRLGGIAMELAEAAGDAARAEIEDSRTAQPDPDDEPGAKPVPAARRIDHAKTFLSAASAVQDLIALELRVDAAPAAAAGRRPAIRPAPPPDPRRPLLRKVLHDALRNDPDRARRCRESDACVEEELLADLDGARPIAEILHAICTKLAIDVELSRVPDEFLDFDEPIKTLTRPKIRDHSS